MSRQISRAESFETTYKAFQNINFTAYDFHTVKQSLIDYIKLYFPENFNDYIESSEFIAVLELFAYVAELITYRIDVSAHENFLPTAQRKESILRLAKLISYNPSRNIAARGLVKVTSIQTTEAIFDSSGRALANKKINWNDPVNADWKEQFLNVINRIFKQSFGTVSPDERIQVDDVLFELYSLNNTLITNGVIPYNASVSGDSIPMELVPVDLNANGPLERRPDNEATFTLLYGNDGLGDASDTTGFFMMTKQGTLQQQLQAFDGVTPNMSLVLNSLNINETDVWVNNVDFNNELNVYTIVDEDTTVAGKSGEWQEVDLAHAQNIVFNTNPNRNKYELETLADDGVRVIFGDGEFADIPSGTFQFWYRSSANDDIVVPKSSVIDQQTAFTYLDDNGNPQTISITFSLVNTLQNASPSEDIEHIRQIAPAVYYTQDRMVNGRDYNTFMLQDPSILKMRAVNRTFSGDSKYISWNEGSESYENVKIFGSDLAIYYKNSELNQTLEISPTSVAGDDNQQAEQIADQVIDTLIRPLISSQEFLVSVKSRHPSLTDFKRVFTTLEEQTLASLIIDIALNPTASVIGIWFDAVALDDAGIQGKWVFEVDAGGNPTTTPTSGIVYSASEPLIELKLTTVPDKLKWTSTHFSDSIVAESPTTAFWNSNDATRTVNFDTLLTETDRVVVLKANENANSDGLLSKNWEMHIIGHELVEPGLEDEGLPNIHQLRIITPDTINEDLEPDDVDMDEIISVDVSVANGASYTPPRVSLFQDVTFGSNIDAAATNVTLNGVVISLATAQGTPATYNNDIITLIDVVTTDTNPVDIKILDYVYFSRDSEFDPWVIVDRTVVNVANWIADVGETVYKRALGRDGLNFYWAHTTPRLNLVDPATTNIIDAFLITRGHYTSTNRWLTGTSVIAPTPPTPFQLRNDYSSLLENKMISDTMVLHPGKFRILFGSFAEPEVRAKFKVIKKPQSQINDNQLKVGIVNTIRTFFNVEAWEFGETFYFTELASAIHQAFPNDVDSVIIVPSFANNQFGDMFQVRAREDEIFQAHVTIGDIELVSTFNPQNMRQ